MMKIPFYHIDRFYQNHKAKINAITDEVFASGQVLEGKSVALLEENLSRLCQRKYAVMTGSCTDALYFSLKATGIKQGDEVIVPAYSFIASASPIVRVGATPIFVDTDITGNMDMEKAQQVVTKKTKAIIPVHLHGKMIHPATLLDFASENNIIIIEDAAQAFGSSFEGIPAGNTGLCSCFSFDPSKIVGAFGTGGAVLTDDPEIYKQILAFRSQGKNAESGLYSIQGYNSRISTLQAALILFQTEILTDIIQRRKTVAEKYYNLIPYSDALSHLPIAQNNEAYNYHKFPLFTPQRDKLKTFLKEQGIETGIHYPQLLPDQPLFEKPTNRFPTATQLSKTTLSLPIYPELSDDEISYICQTIHTFFKNH
ncbi:MAG: hypothetical protein CVU05_04455 [Bacteroidetes bacterium HGW-Bacteroidetes-21]|nr:MAG: hypothetical protein CVU05_04455 [Bacteroidetes bacterium HGW-Bacteroidetes-21]